METFSKTITFDARDVADSVTVLREIEDIYPELSDASLTHHLLQSLHLDEFRSRLKSLGSRVILVDPNNLCEERHAGDGRVCIYRVEVKPSYGQLTVYGGEDSFHLFRKTEHFPKAFLVTSNSSYVIDTKLAVFKKYKTMCESEEVRIYHEFDPEKDFHLYCSKHTIDSFQGKVEKLVRSIPMNELQDIVRKAADVAFSREEIRKSCQDIEIVTEGQNIGSVRDGSYSCRSPFTIRRIKEALISRTLEKIGQEFKDAILSGIMNHIQCMLEVQFMCEVNKINIMKGFTIEVIGKIALDATVFCNVVQFLHPLIGIITTIVAVGTLVLTFVNSVDVNSVEWRNKIANEINENISPKKEEIISNVCGKMGDICQQTVNELRQVSEKLASAGNRIPILEQEKLIDEWMLREFRITGIESNPSILNFIAGRKNNKIVMKVFLRDSDPNLEVFCTQNAVNMPKGAVFEFTVVSIRPNSRGIFSSMQTKVKSANIRGKITRIKEILRTEKNKLFAKYSNIVSISMSPEEARIVFYCLDADLIPFGEEPLPKSIENFECIIIEDFIHFGGCENCPALDHGCSIGRYGNSSSGSLGFFARKRSHSSDIGFLTAAHVALTDDDIATLNERRLSESSFQKEKYQIVHPSFEDSASNNIIGQVEDSFFGNYRSSGIDAAFIKTDAFQKQMNYYSLTFKIDSDEECDVIKQGRTTGETKGILKDSTFFIRKPFPGRAGIYIVLDNCYSIYDSNSQIFFLPGDSGAAVYVVNKRDGSRQPFGLAFGRMDNSPITFACPIEKIADVLNLLIYEPAEYMEVI